MKRRRGNPQPKSKGVQLKHSRITLTQGQLTDGRRFWSSGGTERCDSCGCTHRIWHGGPTEVIALGYFLYSRDDCVHLCLRCSDKLGRKEKR